MSQANKIKLWQGHREETDQHMVLGVAKRWNHQKGFGFISPDNGEPDIFCHVTSIGGDDEGCHAFGTCP